MEAVPDTPKSIDIEEPKKFKQPHIPPSGIWCPAVTLFDSATDSLDIPNQKKYFEYLTTTGLVGLVILGTNAEAFLLTREERTQLISAARSAAGPTFPIMAGVGAHSTAQVLLNITDAVAAGADYVLALPPAYFGKATSPAVIKRFFSSIATFSPVPVIIYNFPGVCNGVDLDSDTICSIVQSNDNVVGVKLTCGSVAKITRLAGIFAPEEFAVFGGQSDFLIGGLAAGSAGCIAAFANVAPRTVVKVYELYQEGRMGEALKLHQEAALAENITRQSIAATKYAAAITSAREAGIEGAEKRMMPRAPYGGPTAAVREDVEVAVKRLWDFEAQVKATPYPGLPIIPLPIYSPRP